MKGTRAPIGCYTFCRNPSCSFCPEYKRIAAQGDARNLPGWAQIAIENYVQEEEQ